MWCDVFKMPKIRGFLSNNFKMAFKTVFKNMSKNGFRSGAEVRKFLCVGAEALPHLYCFTIPSYFERLHFLDF